MQTAVITSSRFRVLLAFSSFQAYCRLYRALTPSFYHLSHPFSVVDKRCSSAIKEIVIQQSMVIVLIWKSQHPDRQRNSYGTLFICYYMELFWRFVRLLKVDGIWGPESWVSRRMVKNQLWRSSLTEFLFSFSRLNSCTFCCLQLTTPLFCFFTSNLICGFSQWGKITKHYQKADAPPSPPPVTTQQIQFGNPPPPLLDLINRHSLLIFLLVCSVLHSIAYLLINFDLIFKQTF